jgi:CubicO group peptidase (beta-lactamase class C family)
MTDLVSKISRQAIEDRVFPGCVIGVVKKDGARKVYPFGNFTYESDSRKIKGDTIFDVASITKSIPTGCLALKLIDERLIRTTDRLIDFVPEFRNSDRENVLIKHLLTYALDGYGVASLWNETPEKLLEYIMTHDFQKNQGQFSNTQIFQPFFWD